MEERSVIVVGGGISGLAFAWHARRSGSRPLVLEASSRLGGCMDSRRAGDFWFELGAHTLYNSYTSLLEIVDGSDARPTIVERGEARKKFGFLRGGALTTMGPLSVFKQFRWGELLASVPRGLFARKQGKTTSEHFGRLIGAKNYAEVLAPFLSAVPSQPVDDFPAEGPGSLFKKRTRRKDVVKSFTFDGGVGAIVDAIAASGLEVMRDAPVREIRRRGAGFEVHLEGGRSFAAPVVAVAVDPATAARLVATDYAPLAAALEQVATVELDTVGVVVRKEDVALPELAFVVPQQDLFWSAVTRDPVPDASQRAFTFHFRPGHDRATRLARIAEVLKVPEARLTRIFERRTVLPAPSRAHAAVVTALDARLAGGKLALTGNYFAGLAIEDCVARSKAEWARVGGGAG